MTDSFGNKEQAFTFTLHTEGASDSETYEWRKNGVVQSDKLHSGSSFTLKDGENVAITLPKHVLVTITEANAGYDTSLALGENPAEKGNTKTFTLTKDTTLAVVNTRDVLLPTGVSTTMTLAVILLIAQLAGMAFLFMRHRKKKAA